MLVSGLKYFFHIPKRAAYGLVTFQIFALGAGIFILELIMLSYADVNS